MNLRLPFHWKWGKSCHHQSMLKAGIIEWMRKTYYYTFLHSIQLWTRDMDAISPIVCTDMRMFLNNIIKGNLLLLQWHLPRTSNKKKKKSVVRKEQSHCSKRLNLLKIHLSKVLNLKFCGLSNRLHTDSIIRLISLPSKSFT